MKCLTCEKELNLRNKKYCSNECKLKSKQYNECRKIKPTLDSNIIAICKITGKEFLDYLNISGALTRHLKSLGIEVIGRLKNIDSYFDIRKSNRQETIKYKCKYCDWETLDLKNKSGCITVHLNKKHNIDASTHLESYPEDESLWIYSSQKTIKNYYLNKDLNDQIKCNECGDVFKRITKTHLNMHGMTMREYRNKYSLNNCVLSSKNLIQTNVDNYYKNSDKININIKSSKMEDDLCKYLDSVGIEYIRNCKNIIKPLELDIYIPSKNVAIEMNGLYWHSENSGKKLKDYHVGKLEACEMIGIRLISIFEDEWNNKNDIVLSKISNILGVNNDIKIYARKCAIKEISNEQRFSFLEKYHIQGSDTSKIKIGLFYKEELVSVMTFSTLRRSLGSSKKEHYYELCRYATKYKIVGGASKCLNFFIKKYQPHSIISYADRRWTSSLENVYEKINFKKINTTKPGYWYTINYKTRHHRYNFNKSILIDKFGADPNKSEREIMYELGYDKIYDCGNLKYEMVL